MKRLAAAMLLCALLVLGGCAQRTQNTYYLIDHFFIPGDGETLKSNSEQLMKDLFSWYQSIEGGEGVYILHSDLYSKETLEAWRESGYNSHAPDADTWYFTVSPNYLQHTGITLTDEQLSETEKGVRLYLIPDRYSDAEAEELKLFLTEAALYGLDGGDRYRYPFYP